MGDIPIPSLSEYQTLKGVCFFEGDIARRRYAPQIKIPDAERRLLL